MSERIEFFALEDAELDEAGVRVTSEPSKWGYRVVTETSGEIEGMPGTQVLNTSVSYSTPAKAGLPSLAAAIATAKKHADHGKLVTTKLDKELEAAIADNAKIAEARDGSR